MLFNRLFTQKFSTTEFVLLERPFKFLLKGELVRVGLNMHQICDFLFVKRKYLIFQREEGRCDLVSFNVIFTLICFLNKTN